MSPISPHRRVGRQRVFIDRLKGPASLMSSTGGHKGFTGELEQSFSRKTKGEPTSPWGVLKMSYRSRSLYRRV